MKKRQRNKLMKKFLSEDELKVIRLYHECKRVSFTKFSQPKKDAVQFCEIIKKPRLAHFENSSWFIAEKDRIEVTAFLDESEVTNND